MSDKSKTVKEKAIKKVETFKDVRKEKIARIKSKIKNGSQKKPANPNTVTSNKLKLLITIVAKNKAEFYLDILQSFDVNMQFLSLAHGTADAKTLGYLGLTDSDKVVIFSVIQENKLPEALETLNEKFKTIKNGKGIAYTVPLSSVIGTLIYGFLSNNRMAVKEHKQI